MILSSRVRGAPTIVDIADGSVWANGDHRPDVVGITFSGGAGRLEVWRATAEGFVHAFDAALPLGATPTTLNDPVISCARRAYNRRHLR
jgi:hypothetical protein